MDNLWNNLVKGLQEGAAAAADKAGDLTRLARARLDIAAAKSQLHRTQADLGVRVHQLLETGDDIVADDQVQALNQQIKDQSAALADCEAAYDALQSTLRAEERTAD